MASHIATVRSSARMAMQHKNSELNSSEPGSVGQHLGESSDFAGETNEVSSELSQMSILSISEDEHSPHKMNIRRSRSQPSSSNKPVTELRVLPPPLETLTSVSDIEVHFDEDLHQLNTLNKIEQRWKEISTNFDAVVNHLQQCSDQVMEASTNCLQSLANSIENTCDKVDGELKAFYYLMTKCDELTTKLSITTSFRDEVKTLRKSVETLEHLFKARPQIEQQRLNQQSKS